jgi:hypothetical protein
LASPAGVIFFWFVCLEFEEGVQSSEHAVLVVTSAWRFMALGLPQHSTPN